jgi:uncharacterized protein (TIGR00369 family)
MLREAGWAELSEKGLSLTLGGFWSRPRGDALEVGLLTDERHANRAGAVHGGVYLALADQMMGYAVSDGSEGLAHATIQLDLQFLASAAPGAFLRGAASISRRTRSIVFVRAEVWDEDRLVAITTGIWKQLHRCR